MSDPESPSPPGGEAGEERTEPLEPATCTGPPLRTLFRPGEVVAGRFRIRRFLAAGGMGQVFEAEDLELGGPVALKTLRPEVSSDPRAMERLRQEIRMARQVTHPNVCRIIDIEHHHGADGDIAFVSMELRPGETLLQRVRRHGRLSTAEALPLVEQMCAGLQASHQAGIVHRDFKSANVVLVPRESGWRAVITDFGLARTEEGPSLTDANAIVGTPDYLAPEQVEGKRATAAADIYALGVVLYEMVTGARPFSGDSAATTALSRLTTPPTSPRRLVPDLDPRWEAVILRCLERKPADRFAGAADVVTALRESGLKGARRRRTLQLAAAGLLAVTVAMGYSAWVERRFETPKVGDEPRAVPAPVRLRRSVAVLGFRNLSGRPEAAWLSTALSEMLTTELSAGGKLRTISSESVARAKTDLWLPEAESYAPEALSRIRERLTTDLIVLGTYSVSGGGAGELRLELTVQDAATGAKIASFTETGSAAEIIDLAAHAGSQLRERLGVGTLSATEKQALAASHPANAEAARLYAQGLERLRRSDIPAAQELLEKSAAADPDFAGVHSALVQVGGRWGRKAQAAAKRAFELSERLPPETRLRMEAHYRQISDQPEKAIELYRSLFASFPDNLEYGVALAMEQHGTGKAADGLATIAALRRLPPPLRDDPEIDFSEAMLAGLSDFRQMQKGMALSAAKARALGHRALLARARSFEGFALWQLRELDTARAAYEEARRIYWDLGERAAVDSVMMDLAGLQQDGGDLDGARRAYEAALRGFRERGIQYEMGRATQGFGMVLYARGQLAAAEKSFEEGLALARDSDLRFLLTPALLFLGNIAADRGDLAGARARYDEGLQTSRAMADKRLVADSLGGVATVLLEQADLAGARKTLDEASALRRELRSPEAPLTLARLLLEDGQTAEAEKLAGEAVERLRAWQDRDGEAWALAAVASAQLLQGKGREARETIDRARTLAQNTQSPATRLVVGEVAARVEAAAGRFDKPMMWLIAALAESAKIGDVRLQYRMRLALGELEMKAGRVAAGRARLEALERDAGDRGFELVARKARKAIR